MNSLTLGVFLLQLQLASVEGVVTKPGGREPLGRTPVVLSPVVKDAILSGPSAVTEDDGRFVIRNVPPGDYQLVVDTARYGYVVYGQRRPDGPGIILTLTAGQRVSDIKLTMAPTGAISGRITGRNGEPAVNAQVHALRFGYQNGKRTLQMAQAATSDDRGEYRLFGLPAGSYLVLAALREFANGPNLTGGARLNAGALSQPGLPNEIRMLLLSESTQAGNVVHRVLEDGTVEEESWAPLYYPSATEARYAVPVEVEAGATRTGIDIAIGPAPVKTIRGRVTGGSALGSLEVQLFQQETGMRLANSTGTQFDGSFEFTGILPGSYYLRATDTLGGLVSIPIPLEVANRDVDDVRISLVPAVRIGVVVLQDNPAGPQPLADVGLVLLPEVQGTSRLTTNGPSQAGTGRTSIADVAPGSYQIRIMSYIQLPQTGVTPGSFGEVKRFHIKSVRFGNRDASEGIQVDAGSPAILEVVVTDESGSIRGTVSGAGQSSTPGATVVLVPEKGRKREDLYSVMISDAAGSFRFDGIAPGDYRLFAWEDVENGAWQDPEFLRKFESKGQPVTVSGNSRQDVRLTLIRNP